MAKIEITRTTEWINNAGRIRVYLDGQKIGSIYDGETKEFEVTGGKHKLRAKINWCGSQVFLFTINENETKAIRLSGFKHSKYLMGITAGIIALHFLLKHTFNIDFFIWLIIPAFLILAYYFTIGRNHYLIIREN